MWLRVSAMVLRYLYLYRRSLARAGEIFFWPVMDLLVWGFVTSFLQRMDVPDTVLFLIGGMIFWDVLYRSQQAITLSLGEEIFVRNIINIFVAPISVFEIMLATCLMGVIKATITAVVLGVLGYVLFAFNLLDVGPALLPFLASLLLFGWAVGMCTMALILRFGQSAEALIWGIPFLLQPVSAVFYPLDVLPGWLQVVARFFPSSHVFEGMRAALRTGRVDGGTLVASFAMNLLWLAIGASFFAWMFRIVRDRGYLSRLGLE